MVMGGWNFGSRRVAALMMPCHGEIERLMRGGCSRSDRAGLARIRAESREWDRIGFVGRVAVGYEVDNRRVCHSGRMAIDGRVISARVSFVHSIFACHGLCRVERVAIRLRQCIISDRRACFPACENTTMWWIAIAFPSSFRDKVQQST